jgi:hypothetical protein
MRFRLIIFLILTISPQIGKAQDTVNFHSYEGAMDTIFGAIDTNLIQSHILLNRAPYDDGFINSDGTNVNAPTLKWYDFLFYHEVIKAASRKKYCNYDSYDLAIIAQQNHLSTTNVDLAVLNFKYQYIPEVNFTNGNLMWDNPQIIINLDDASSIIEERRNFSCAPIIGNTVTKDVIFKLSDSLYFTNDTILIDSILADFGDGAGYRNIEFDTDYPVSFTDTQTVILRFAFYFSNSTILRSSSSLKINDFTNQERWFCNGDEQLLQTPYLPPNNDPTTLTITFNDDDGNPVNGTYGIWLGCGNTAIRKPVLVMHGFNPFLSKQLLPCFSTWFSIGSIGMGGAWRGTLYETYNGVYNDDFSINETEGLPNGAEFLNRLREEGYDIIIPQLNNGTDYVRKNAAFIRGMIYQINSMTEANGSKHELVVLGYSLGAVSTRFALAKAERLYEQYKNTPNTIYYPHPRCRLWVSVEGEYQGCTTPISFQNHVYFWGDAIPLNPLDIMGWLITKQAQKAVDNPAAMELSSFHALSSTTTHVYPHPYRNILLNDFSNNVGLNTSVESLRGYPQYCRRVGVSDGSSTGIKNTWFPNIRTKLFELKTTSNILLSTCFHRESEGYTCDPNGYLNNDYTYHRENYMTLFYIHRINFIDPGTAYNYYQNLLEYDRMPGSMLANNKYYFEPPSPIALSNDPLGPPVSLCRDIYSIRPVSFTWGNYCYGNTDLNSFVPTVSSLDLYNKDQIKMSSYNAGLLANVSSMNLFKLNAMDHHPYETYGFPHLNTPSDPYKNTPFDAVWALGTNQTAPNRMHVEDPAVDQAVYLANVEIAPLHLFLSNRTIHDFGDNYRIYKAAFEARNKITAGFQIYANNIHNINSSNYIHQLTPDGDFIIKSRTEVDFKAGDEIILQSGFEVQFGAEFHAFIEQYPPICPDDLRMISNHSGSSHKWNSQHNHANGQTSKNQTSKITILPNPSIGNFSIQINNTQVINTKLQIMDFSGRTLYTQPITVYQGLTQIEISKPELPAGIYFISIDGINETIKIIIAK